MKREDKQIRMKLREACEPEKTFEQFCVENNIEITKKRDDRKLLLKTLLPCVASAAVVLAVVLPITLRDTAPVTKPEEPLYGHITDENYKYITMDDLLADKDLIMYDLSGQYSYADVAAYYTDDWKEVSFYSISDVLWVNDLECEEPEFFFEFNYKVRRHKDFPVYEEETYINLKDTYEYNGIVFHYEYDDHNLYDKSYMYIYFKSGTYDYFFTTNDIYVTTGDNVAQDMIKLLFA